jgi:hypothetical protein
MSAQIEVPGYYGHSDVGALAMTLTVTSRLTAFRPTMPELLPPQLARIPDTGHCYGAHMQADPALDLSDPAERAGQVDSDPAERAGQVDMWLSGQSSVAGLAGGFPW